MAWFLGDHSHDEEPEQYSDWNIFGCRISRGSGYLSIEAAGYELVYSKYWGRLWIQKLYRK